MGCRRAKGLQQEHPHVVYCPVLAWKHPAARPTVFSSAARQHCELPLAAAVCCAVLRIMPPGADSEEAGESASASESEGEADEYEDEGYGDDWEGDDEEDGTVWQVRGLREGPC